MNTTITAIPCPPTNDNGACLRGPPRDRQNLLLVLARFGRKYREFETRLASIRSLATPNEKQTLIRSTERLLSAAKAVHSTLSALASYLSTPTDAKVVEAAVNDLEGLFETWNRAWHAAHVAARNAHDGTPTKDVLLGVAEELLQLELDAADTFQPEAYEPVDPHVAERLSKALNVPLAWLLRSRCRRFWQNMKMPSLGRKP